MVKSKIIITMKKKIYTLVSVLLKIYRFPKSFFIKKRLGKCGNDVVIAFPCKMSKPQNVYLDEHTLIQPNVTFIMNAGKVYVGKWSVIASNCTLITDNHIPTVGVNHRMLGRYHINDKVKDIILEEDCWAGAGVTLLSGAKLGRGSIAAAGALVNKQVPPYAVVAGIPAKIIASVFTKEQILQHEQYLYPENERMGKDEIDKLFEQYFVGKKAIGQNSIAVEDYPKVVKHKQMQFAIPQI